MTTLAEDAVRTYLDNRQLFIGLGLDGKELTDRNYTQQPAVRWTIKRNVGEYMAEFGPFFSRVEFNEVLIFSGEGKHLRTVPFKGGSIVLVAKASYRHLTKIDFRDLR